MENMEKSNNNSGQKRVRFANWDIEEKRLLNQLILGQIDVIEKKDTSTNTNSMKKAAWQEVVSSFNSLNSKKRDLKELMTQWRNTKGKVKLKDSEYKRAKLMTGGGPPPPSPSPEDVAIIQAIPNEFVVDNNKFDSDSVYTNCFNQLPSSGNTMVTDTNDPWTPLPSSSIQIEETEEILHDVDLTRKIITTPTKKPMQDRSSVTKGCKPHYNKKKTKGTINKTDDYEHQLFLIAKKSKENKEQREDELHKKRLIILDLEQQYWEKKFKKI